MKKPKRRAKVVRAWGGFTDNRLDSWLMDPTDGIPSGWALGEEMTSDTTAAPGTEPKSVRRDDSGLVFPLDGISYGMTVRQWSAGQILRDLIWQDSDMHLGYEEAAREAFKFADAMVTESRK